MKLLIVEDQVKTGQYLRQGLSEAGFTTELAADGITGQHLALTGDYSLLILDVMLPGRDGWQILQAVRSAGLVSTSHGRTAATKPGTRPATRSASRIMPHRAAVVSRASC